MGAYATAELDSELYPELGYGEVASSMVDALAKNYYWTAKIEKVGDGARMTIHSGNTLDAPHAVRRLEHWAAGGTGCS